MTTPTTPTTPASPATLPRRAGPGQDPVEGRSPFRLVPLVAVAFTMVMMVRIAARPLWDPDLWWHLRLGEELRSGWSVTDPGQLTTYATKDWFVRSWLPDVATSWVEDQFGLPAVAWVYGLLLLVLVVVVYAVARRQAEVLVASLTAVAVMFAAGMSLTPRPHLLSYVLLVLATAAWIATIDDLRPPWWLIPATWVWAASNGMWSTGVVVGVAVIAGLALDRRLDWRSGLRLATVPVGSVVAAAITPAGPQLLFGATESWGWQRYISEFATPALTNPRVLATWVLIAVIGLTWVKQRQEVSWARIGVLGVAALWTMFALRSVTWGALMTTPLLAGAMQSWLPRRPRLGITRREVAALGLATALSLVVLALFVPTTSDQPGRVPLGLDDELAALPAGTPILNEYALGGWLEWRHRHLEPVIDGNTNAYFLSDMEEYRRALGMQPSWQDYVTEKEVTHALLAEGSPLDHALQTQLGWRQVDTDLGYSLTQAPAD